MFLHKSLDASENSFYGTHSLPFCYWYTWIHERPHSTKAQSHWKLYLVKVSCRKQKLKVYLQMKGLVLHSSTDLWHTFGRNVAVLLRRRRPQQPKLASYVVHIHSHVIQSHDCVRKSWWYNGSFDSLCFSWLSKLTAENFIITRLYINFQTSCNLNFSPPLKKIFTVLTWIWETRAGKN